MASNTPKRLSSVSKKSIDFANQSRVTKFFKPNSQEEIVKTVGESLPAQITTKKIHDIFSEYEELKSSKEAVEVIPVNSSSSESESEAEENAILSPPKKARVMKRPLFSFKNAVPKESDPLMKKPGLVLRNNQSSSGSNRQALEERKNFNLEEKSLIIEQPVGQKKPFNSDLINENANKSLNTLTSKNSKSTHLRNENPESSREIVRKNADFTRFMNEYRIPKLQPTNSTAVSSTKTKRNSDSDESRTTLDRLEERLKPKKKVKTQPQVETRSPEPEVSEPKPGKKKRPASPDFSNVSNEIFKSNFDVIRSESTTSPSEKRQKTAILVSVSQTDIDTAPTKSTKNVENVESDSVKSNEIVSSNKGKPRRIISRSAVNAANKHGLSVNSNIIVGLEEISSSAVVAFQHIYKNIETLLDMNLDVRTAPNIEWCVENPRCLLPNRSHVNFRFFMKRGECGDHIGALNALRTVSYRYYPHAQDLHAIVHDILKNCKEQVVLHRAQELIHKVLGLHPPVDAGMRKYYWSVISQKFDDTEPFARWENMRSLLEKVLNDDSQDSRAIYADADDKPPTKLECRRAKLGFLIHLLKEDLRCWISQTDRPATLLKGTVNLPMIARLLWPHSTIPHVNGSCRELIQFHVAALKSGNEYHICYTAPLMKMMAVVTQLSGTRFPLKIRRPTLHMLNLAREIVLHSECLIDSQISFYHSFGTLELSLLLSLSVLNRQKPQIPIPEGNQLSFKWLLSSFLTIDESMSVGDVKTRILAQPVVERNAFSTALTTYSRLYCAFETWLNLRQKYRNPTSRLTKPAQPHMRLKSPTPVDIFSGSFSQNHLMDDLRQTKFLLTVQNRISEQSIYSSLCWTSP